MNHRGIGKGNYRCNLIEKYTMDHSCDSCTAEYHSNTNYMKTQKADNMIKETILTLGGANGKKEWFENWNIVIDCMGQCSSN